MQSQHTYVFIDANIALHFKRIDQIDWPSLTGSPAVTLVLAPVFFREVDQEKVENPKKKIRDRAASTLRWIDGILSAVNSAPIRQGVTLTALIHEPQIDFAANRLSTSIADDHLIASVLDFSSSHTEPVLIATADVGLKQKLRGRTLEPLAPAEIDRLPEEPDPLEKELENARREVHSLKFRQPALVVEFESGSDHLEFTRPLCGEAEPLSISAIRTKYPQLMVDQQHVVAPVAADDKFARLAMAGITPSMVDRYNSDLDSYYRKYQQFLDEMHRWRDEIARMIRAVFVLSNDGRSPATDIDAILTFPSDIQVLKAKTLRKRPKEPQPPAEPGVFSFDLLARPEYRPDDLLQHTLDISRNYDGVPFVKEGEQNRVSFSLGNLKHGFKFTLDGIFICFPSYDAVRSITIGVNISAAELPEKVEHDIHLILAES